MRIHFKKMTGAGNDFVVIDNRENLIKSRRNVAAQLCNRRWGIGADGLLLVEKSQKADFLMRYYNSDGSYGGMCGNGGRCISLFAYQEGIAKKIHRFEALGHIYRAIVDNVQVSLFMKNPSEMSYEVEIPLNGKKIKAAFLDTGSPHVVITTSQLGTDKKIEEIDVVRLGRTIRNMRSLFKEGTNVNFIALNKAGSIRMRTYERGVEDETLACGTGAIASAIVAGKYWKLRLPVKIRTQSKRILSVDYTISGNKISNVILTGPAEFVFEGSIEI